MQAFPNFLASKHLSHNMFTLSTLRFLNKYFKNDHIYMLVNGHLTW